MKKLFSVLGALALVVTFLHFAPQIGDAGVRSEGVSGSGWTLFPGNMQLGDNSGNDTVDVSGVLEVDSTLTVGGAVSITGALRVTGQGQGSFIIAATDTASDDDYLVATNTAIGTIQTGQLVMLDVVTANTGAASLTFGTNLASKAIKNTDKADIDTNDVLAGDYAFLYYDGTQWILLNPASGTP